LLSQPISRRPSIKFFLLTFCDRYGLAHSLLDLVGGVQSVKEGLTSGRDLPRHHDLAYELR
jgi:hypothetical protein